MELPANDFLRLGITQINTSNDLRTIVPGSRWPPNTLQFSSDTLMWRWDSADFKKPLKVIISNFFSRITGLSFKGHLNETFEISRTAFIKNDVELLYL